MTTPPPGPGSIHTSGGPPAPQSPAPGDRPPPGSRSASLLAEPPSARYARAGDEDGTGRPAATSTIVRRRVVAAIAAALAGAAAIVVLVQLLETTTGLLIIAGAIGLAVGSQLPAGPAAGLALASVVAGDVGTWLYARSEGGVLGLADYVVQVLGLAPFGQAVVAMASAWWASERLRAPR